MQHKYLALPNVGVWYTWAQLTDHSESQGCSNPTLLRQKKIYWNKINSLKGDWKRTPLGPVCTLSLLETYIIIIPGHTFTTLCNKRKHLLHTRHVTQRCRHSKIKWQINDPLPCVYTVVEYWFIFCLSETSWLMLQFDWLTWQGI
jgi:hypothetical protein